MHDSKKYLTAPELRIFWLFAVLVLAVLAIGFLYLPTLWAIVNLIILAGLGAIVFSGTIRTARANSELTVAHARLEHIIRDLKDGVVAYDQNFKILVFNNAAAEIFNVAPEEVMGHAITLKMKQESESKYRLLLMVLFPALAPLVVRRSEPGIFPQIADFAFDDPKLELRVTTNQLRDADDKPVGFIKIVRDRTRELSLLRAKSEFITLASHQLRTPLTAINWAWEGLRAEPLAAPQQQLVQTGAESTVRLLKVIDDLIDTAKIEEGRFGYQFAEVDLGNLLTQIVAAADIIARKHQVRAYFEKPDGVELTIVADQTKLSAGIANLVDNAIKYNVAGGQVTIKVEHLPNQPYLVVRIADTGVGIPEPDAKNLFKKFYRGENVKKFAVDGSGLGLYIAQNIIRRHGGKIWFESTPNRGTTFSFTLPTDPKLIPPKEVIYEEE